MKSKRIAKWDNIKFVLIALVAIGHMISYYTGKNDAVKSLYFFIYTFHMPAFIFISGMLMKHTIIKKKYDKVFSYLILGVFIKVLNFLAKAWANGEFKIRFFDENTVAWYAFAIFVFAMATIYLQRFNRVHIFVLAVIVGIFAGYDGSADTTLSLGRIFAFYPFFLAGFFISPEKLLEWSKKIYLKIIGILLIAEVFVISFVDIDKIYWLLPLLKGKNTYKALGDMRPYGGLLRLAYYVIVFALVFAVMVVVPNVKSFLSSMGARTLSIYSFHVALITIVRGVFHVDRLLKMISPENYEFLTIVVALLIVAVTSLKPLNDFVSFAINPKLRIMKTSEESL